MSRNTRRGTRIRVFRLISFVSPSFFVLTGALLAWIVISLMPLVAPAQQSADPKSVLVLYWYNKDYPWNAAFDKNFRAALQSARAGTVEYYAEYLESNRFPGENQSLALRDFLRRKYAARHIDVVVANSDASLDFLLKYHDSLFPHTPIVFVAARHPRAEDLAARPDLTGIVNLSTHRKTLDLALRLHPDTQQVFVISGTLQRDKRFERLAREDLQGYENRVTLTYLTDYPPDELLLKTSSLPERSIVLYVWQQSQDEQGHVLESADIFALIARSVPVPIYGMSNPILGGGVVGGYIVTAGAVGTRAAELTLRILSGERAQDIPPEIAPTEPIFDWRQLQRWGISEDELPHGSIIRFKEFTFWAQYKLQLVGVISLIALEGFLITILLLERNRRQRASQELSTSEKRYRQMFEENRAVQLLFDRETGEIVDANTAAVEFYGYSLEDLRRMNLSDIETATRVPWIEEANRALNEGRSLRHRLASGEVRDVEVHSSPLEAGGRSLSYWIIHDVTERKRAEAELILLQTIGVEAAAAIDLNSALEVVLRRVVENTGWTFGQAWIPSQDATFLECGPVWMASLDLEDFCVLSRKLSFPPDVGLPGRVWESREPAWVQNVTEDENFRRGAVAKQVNLKGALAVPILSDQKVIAVLEFFLREPRAEDERLVNVITAVAAQLGLVIERKRAHDALNLLNIELEQRIIQRTAALNAKSRELESFAYSVAHDLKAPLRGIDGYSRLLLEDYADKLDDEGRSFLQTIHTSTEEMGQLIQDLLTYSQLERREMKPDRLELRPLVASVVEQKKHETVGLGIDFVVEVNRGAVVADAGGLTQALRNYLDNAIKFTRDVPEPRIEIGSEEAIKSCRLWVRDNGIGFDMKYHNRIFEIFQRLHRDEDYPGTGVGLAIVRKAMERIGGRAWAESEPGRGATFYLEIPK